MNVDRSLANQIGLTEQNVTTNMQVNLAGSLQTNPTFWLNPKNGVSYPIVIQTPQYWIDSMSDLNNLQVERPATGRCRWAVSRGRCAAASPGVVSHYNVQPVVDIYATTHGRDLGAIAEDIQTILDDTARDVPGGSTVKLRGQVTTMTAAYDQLYLGLALGDRPHLLPDRRELPVVARPVRHHHRAARGAGRHRLVPVPHAHDAVGAGAHGCHHVHGRGHRQLDPGRQLLPREARRRTDADGGGDRGRLHALSSRC